MPGPGHAVLSGRLSRFSVTVLLVLLLSVVAAAIPAVAAAAKSSGWYVQKVGKLTYPGLLDVDFPDRQHGWAVGDGGVILATANGGLTWKAQDSGISADLVGVAFSDSTHGWAVSEFGILATTNGGKTWSVSKTTTGAYWLHAIACTDASHAYAVGGDNGDVKGVVFSTADGGATWSSQEVTSGDGWILHGLNSVTFAGGHGWAVGQYGVVAGTANGVTWSVLRAADIDQPELDAVSFADADHGWAVGYGGAIFVSADGGVTWTRQDSWTDSSFSGVCFADAAHGWAVSWDGIHATADGGAKWALQPLAFYTSPLQAITFRGARYGWAVSCVGDIIATYSGGDPDTRGPVTFAKAASGRVGKTLNLRYKITDDKSPTAKAIKIVIKSGTKTVKTLSCPPAATAVWLKAKWRPKARGTYRFFVRASDPVGNKQRTVGSAKIVVR